MAIQKYLCEVHVLGKGPVKNVELLLSSASQAETKKTATAQFLGQKITGIYNIKLKK